MAPNRRQNYRRRRETEEEEEEEGDLISSLPDVILQHIFCYIPTKLAITTSLLSKRWRYVWCDTPSLSLNDYKLDGASINETLTRHTSSKMMNFELYTTMINNVPHIDNWIKLAMSRNVENMSLDFSNHNSNNYKFPSFFYNNSSLKQLRVELDYSNLMVPKTPVSWNFLKELSFRYCCLSDKSIANILSGCPILKSLTLHQCYALRILDLSKSLYLRTLEIKGNITLQRKGNFRGSKLITTMQIVAPHIHYLRLRSSQVLFTLVDVSSLKEAKVNICISSLSKRIEGDSFQSTVLKMLEKLCNVEKLTLGGNFLQILSLAELRDVSFPMLKVKALTLETAIFRYVIPGIDRVLQNSPDLKKITLHTEDHYHKPGEFLGDYMDFAEDLNLNQCWRSKFGDFWNKSCLDVESKHVVSLVELLILKNTKVLDEIVILFEDYYYSRYRFKDLVPSPRLSHDDYNVSILFTPSRIVRLVVNRKV